MIKANELRIGNYIIKGTFQDGSGYNFGQIEEGECIDYYSQKDGSGPMPLTEEWLLKFDFAKSTSECEEEREVWSRQVANNTSLYFDNNHKYKKWYLSHEWNNNHFQNDFWACPQYVHQLQNLFFALTGEELTIKESV